MEIALRESENRRIVLFKKLSSIVTHDGTKVLYNMNLQDIDQSSSDTNDSFTNMLDFDPMSTCPLCPSNSDNDDSFSDNDAYCWLYNKCWYQYICFDFISTQNKFFRHMVSLEYLHLVTLLPNWLFVGLANREAWNLMMDYPHSKIMVARSGWPKNFDQSDPPKVQAWLK